MSSLANGFLAQLAAFLDARFDAILTEEQLNERGIPPDRHAAYQEQHFLQSFGVRSWYDILTPAHTFRTVLCPLSFREAAALTASERSPADSETLSALQERVDAVLRESFPRGAFVKLETRSPKDVPWNRIRPKVDTPERDRFMPLLDEQLMRLLRSGDEWSLNTLMIAFSAAATAFMCVRSGAETIALLLKSLRIHEDLRESLKIGEELWDLSLVFREWDDRVPELQGYEFRGFVFNRQLTAVTQYNDCMLFAEMVAKRGEIECQIREYFEKICPALPHQHFLIDFIVFSGKEIKVIELNPFTTYAGSGLFHWVEDIERIKNGPFEMRVRTESDPQLSSFVDNYWIDYFNEFAAAHPKTPSRCSVM
jgi:hypothetical protein